MPFPRHMEKETEEAMNDPQVGDRFEEMLTFWVYVVRREGDVVFTLEASAPCTFPDDGELKRYTVDEMKKRFAYGSIDGYWVALADRGRDVAGWYEAAINQKGEQ